jgi:TatD DNase family protein
MAAVPVERLILETDSPYCDVRSTHAGFKHVKTTWPSKKKEKQDAESMVKGRNEPCTMR